MSIASDKIKGKKSKPKTILKWEETNIGSYQEAIETLQEQSNIPDSIADIEEQAFNIIDILYKASNTNVKKKIVSLKGPNWKASEKVKELISKSKNAFYSWKQNGRPKEQDNRVYMEMKNCKREVRKQVRQEDHLDSQRFYNNIMNNPDSKTFHQLIRKNRAQSDNSATLIIKDTNGDDIVEQEKQTDIFAEFYETLATPATKEHFDSEYMEECELRYNLINLIVPSIEMTSHNLQKKRHTTCKTTKEKNLYLATLDSQKAFNVVYHMILLEKLYYEVPADVWKVIQNLYSNMSTEVKWNNHISKRFPIKQGVRQGGVLSTHFYKSYINDLPIELEKRALGLSIGLEYCGSPLCADDIVLMSTDETEIQAMLDIVYKYSCEHRYNIHPQKSTLIKTERTKSKYQPEIIKLGNEATQTDNQATH
ncbi:unnamed protein product [Mytilus coruscus]|uniref:Reverse transcriptase domain-containing protein n=3 Tax=Mytilus coruscus TaxID=42192 RepID=A0A6J8EF42_MYTCO|nr:unnamed protein product [Mytilus coruscus]